MANVWREWNHSKANRRDRGPFVIDEQPDYFLIEVHADVDIASAPDFDAALARHTSTRYCPTIVDLSPCPYLDSSGLAVLIKHHKFVAKPLIIVVPPDHKMIRHVLEITCLANYLHIVPSREAALAARTA